MALKYAVGQKFPSATVLDESGSAVAIEDVAGGRPMILAFFRGPW